MPISPFGTNFCTNIYFILDLYNRCMKDIYTHLYINTILQYSTINRFFYQFIFTFLGNLIFYENWGLIFSSLSK